MITEDVMDISTSDTNMTLGSFYCQLLDEAQEQFKLIFSVLADQSDKGFLFHCAAGKDRTGVVAALLLNLLGAQDADIIANYEVTYSFISSNADLAVAEAHKH